jgi:hypothetical protein
MSGPRTTLGFSKNVEAVAQRINSLADEQKEPEARVTVEQIKHVVACMAADEDVRLMFNFCVLRARSRLESEGGGGAAR